MQPPTQSATRNIYRLILLVLTLLLLVQGWGALQKAREEIGDIYKVNFKPAVWRGAFFARSTNFADTIWFLNQQIPADAGVILPPREAGLEEFGITPLMQFFLAPRHLVNVTESDQYTTSLADGGAYLLVQGIGKSPSGEIDPERLIMQDDTRGVYAPPGAETRPEQDTASRNDTPGKISAALLTTGLLLIVAVAGYAIVITLCPISQKALALMLGLGLGLGMISFIAYLISLVFEFSTYALLASLAITILTAICLGAYRQRHPADRLIPLGERTSRADLLWYAVFLIGTGMLAIVAVGKGYHSADALMLWGARGYGIAADGLREGAANWGALAMKYPLNLPLLIGAFQEIGLEVLPASKILFPIFYLGLLVVIYELLKLYLPAVLSGLLALLFASTPLVVQHAKIGYANLALTFYLVGAVYLFTRLSKQAYQTPGLFLVGTYLAFAAWTRPEGEIVSALTVAGFCVAIWLDRNLERNKKWISMLIVVSPLVIYLLTWHASSGLVYPPSVSNAGLLQSLLESWRQGDFQLVALFEILRYSLQTWFSWDTWGLLGYAWLGILAAGLVPAIWWRVRPRGEQLLIGALAIIYLVAIWGIYYLTSYDQGQDLQWWLNTGYSRMNLPASVLLWVLSAILLAALFSSQAGTAPETDHHVN